MKKSNGFKEGVLIISILSFVFAIFLFLNGVFMFFPADAYRGTPGFPLADPINGEAAGYLSSWNFFWIGLVLIGLSVLFYFIGRDLLKARKWAKYAKGVFAILMIAFAIAMMVNGFFLTGFMMFAVPAVEIWYLFFCKDLAKYFKN